MPTFYNIRPLFFNFYWHKKHFKIQGLTNEIGISTIGGIYLNSDSSLCNYLIESIDILKNTQFAYDTEAIIQLLLDTVFNSNLLESAFPKKDLNDVIRIQMRNTHNLLNMDNDISAEIWKTLDVEKFKEIILSQKHSIFSLSNWNRR